MRHAAIAISFAMLAGTCAPREQVGGTIRDDIGRDVAMPANVARVVTLAPNITEIVYAVGAGAKVVGTDDFSNYPEAARHIPKVGGMQPDIERIAELRPDLVLASTEGNHPALAPALKAAGISLFVIRTDRLDEIAPAIERIGSLLGVATAQRSAGELRRQIDAQKRQRPRRPHVLFAIWTDPLYVAGANTFTNDLLELTGAENVVRASGWPQYSLESLVADPPELILYPRGALTPAQMERLLARLGTRQPRVIAVDEDVFQRPGPRVLAAAAKLNAIFDDELARDAPRDDTARLPR